MLNVYVGVLQIRFFERVKLERRIKQLQGKAKRGHALSAVEQQQIQKWEQELQVCMLVVSIHGSARSIRGIV